MECFWKYQLFFFISVNSGLCDCCKNLFGQFSKISLCAAGIMNSHFGYFLDHLLDCLVLWSACPDVVEDRSLHRRQCSLAQYKQKLVVMMG